MCCKNFFICYFSEVFIIKKTHNCLVYLLWGDKLFVGKNKPPLFYYIVLAYYIRNFFFFL